MTLCDRFKLYENEKTRRRRRSVATMARRISGPLRVLVLRPDMTRRSEATLGPKLTGNKKGAPSQ